MPVPRQSTSVNGSGLFGDISWPSPILASSLLIVQVASSVAVSSITDLTGVGHTYTAVSAETVVNTNNRIRVYYMQNAPAAAAGATVRVSFGSASAFVINIFEYPNMVTTGVLGLTNSGTGFSATPASASITPPAGDWMLFGTLTVENTAGLPVDPGTNYTEVLESTRGNTPALAYAETWDVIANGSTAYTATATLASATNWAIQIAAFKMAPPPPATLDQYAWRWRNDNGPEDTATYKAAQNTAITLSPGDSARLRFGINVTGDPGPKRIMVRTRKVGTVNWRRIY